MSLNLVKKDPFDLIKWYKLITIAIVTESH